MEQISCQGKYCMKNGCPTCGGTGIVFEKDRCRCGQEYWTRPGVVHEWEGKCYRSVDGLLIICHLTEPNGCEKCEGVSA